MLEMRQHHHHITLGLALEEADGGFYAEQQLRRANVSPFFTHCRVPPTEDSVMPELYLLPPSPHSMPRRDSQHEGSQPHDQQRLVIPPPLSLDGFGDDYRSDHERDADSDIAATSLCWQETVPFPERAALQHNEQLQPHHTSSSESVGALASTTSSDAWDLFLNESHSSSSQGTSSGRLDFANALKTPTAESVASFTGFFPYAVNKDDDPTALSPTHMDKKVLVTEQDLKLPSSSPSCGRPSGHGDDWNNSRPSHKYGAALHKRALRVWREELLFAQEATFPTMRRRHSPSSSRSHPYSPLSSASSTQPSRRKNRTSAATTSHGNSPCAELVTPRVPAMRRLPHMSCGPLLTPSTPSRYHPTKLDRQSMTSPTSSPRQHALRDEELLTPRRQDDPFSYMTHGQPRAKTRFRNSNNSMNTTNKTHKPTKRKIGIYTPEARRERLRRFHEKRKQRVFRKRIKYDCRKRLANACPRLKGRFVRKPKVDETTAVPTESLCPPSDEDCSGTSGRSRSSSSNSSDHASVHAMQYSV